MHLLFSTFALLSLYLPSILAIPTPQTCSAELSEDSTEISGYGAPFPSHYCKRSPTPDSEILPRLEPLNAGGGFQACYVIYSSARVKRALGLDDAGVEKRCSKLKARSAEPDPLMISDPFDPDGGGSPGGGGFDGGGEWPGDMGSGFLQCYSTYTTDKKARGVEGLEEGLAGLEKRCRKEKREAEDMVIKRETWVPEELEERKPPRYYNYDEYATVRV